MPHATSMLFLLRPGVYKYGEDGEENEAVQLGIHLKYGKRSKEHLHYGDKDVNKNAKNQAAQMCVVLSAGECISSGTQAEFEYVRDFTPWAIMQKERTVDEGERSHPTVHLRSAHLVEGHAVLSSRRDHASLAERMFHTHQWPKGADCTPPPAAVDESEGVSSKRYEFRVMNHAHHMEVVTGHSARRPGDEGPISKWVQLCNFEFYKYMAIYQFADESPPFHVIQCRWKNPKCNDGKVVCVKHGEMRGDQSLDGVQFVLVDVNVTLLHVKSTAELRALFNTAWPILKAYNLDLDTFHHVLEEMDAPEISSAIVKFGRQVRKGDSYYVMGNCAFKNGLLYTHEEASVAVIHQHFAKRHFMPNMYPKMTMIPFPHVRYHIFTQLWNEIMPSFFQNNEMSAKAVLSLAIMGVHASKFWGGQAGLTKFPLGWVYSASPATGKTYALLVANALLGKGDSLMTGSSTTVAVQMRLDCLTDSPHCIDDYVSPPRPDKQWAELARQLFEHASRSIGGDGACVRTCESPVLVSSNSILCPTDAAVQSRILVIPFDQMHDSDKLEQLQSAMQLLSACLVDVDTLLWNAKLDKECIEDCATFLHQAVGLARDRKISIWAWLLYYMLLVSCISQGAMDEPDRIIEWVVKQARESAFDAKHDNNLVTKFIVAMSKVMPGGSMHGQPLTDKSNEIVFWHNFSTKQLIDDEPTYTFRLQSCCNAIRVKLGERFEHKEVAAALLKWEHSQLCNECQFALTANWPLHRIGGDVGQTYRIALEEHEVMGDLLSGKDQTGMLIQQSAFNAIVEEYRAGAAQQQTVDYKGIMIQRYGAPKHASAVLGCLYAYNFFKMATGVPQNEPVNNDPIERFLFRACRNSTWAPFCGATNHCHVRPFKLEDPNPRVDMWDDYVVYMNAEMGFGSIDETLELEALCGHFDDKLPVLSTLPPAITELAYLMRDDEDEGDVAVTRPCVFHPDHESVTELEDSMHSFSEDHSNDVFDAPEHYERFSPRSSPARSQSLAGFSDEDGDSPSKRQRTDMADKQSSPTHPSNGGSMPLDDISNAQNQMRGDGLASAGDQAVMAAGSAAAAAQAAMEQEIERDLEIEREIQQEDGF